MGVQRLGLWRFRWLSNTLLLSLLNRPSPGVGLFFDREKCPLL